MDCKKRKRKKKNQNIIVDSFNRIVKTTAVAAAVLRVVSEK